jgi:hypothetical protein
MITRIVSLVAVCILMAVGDGRARAGGIHIRYAADAPEQDAAQDVLYYQGVLNLYHNHPTAFAREHPFYTKMFGDPVMMDKLLARWEANEQRFEYWHNCLWKVLNGYLHSHPSQPVSVGSGGSSVSGASGGGGTVAPQGLGPGGSPSGGNGSGGNGPGGNGSGNGGTGRTGGGSGPGTQSVPEPSSGLLMISATLIAGSWFAYRRPCVS